MLYRLAVGVAASRSRSNRGLFAGARLKKKSSISWTVEMEDVLMGKRSNEGLKTLGDIETKGLKES